MFALFRVLLFSFVQNMAPARIRASADWPIKMALRVNWLADIDGVISAGHHNFGLPRAGLVLSTHMIYAAWSRLLSTIYEGGVDKKMGFCVQFRINKN
jgi:hypothetical protein